MPEDSRIVQLIQDILESDSTPEAVCSDCPELLPEVRERLRRCRDAEAQIEAMFPLTGPMVDASAILRWGVADRLPQIAGYQMEAVLGRGGMGVVYKALHLKLRRPVALKMMLSGPFAGQSELGRFMREAEAIAALRHEHIVQVYDVGDADGCPYFTMEYMEGGTLAEKLGGVPQPALQAATLGVRLAGAIQAAHRAGILHRDLKPSNVLLTADGIPKITDFGLARRLDADPLVTQTGVRMGTPSYMAPEQVIGKHGTIGPAADVYSLGAVLYEMLTGRPPFRGENARETERQVTNQDPVPPSSLNAKVPLDLNTICLKCLHKDPLRRYATAADLGADLERFLTGRPIVARPISPAERAMKWARRRPALASLLATLVLALGGAIAVGITLQRQANTRRHESELRERTASQAIDTALALVVELRQNERWIEARHVMQDAKSRLTEANSPRVQERFDRIAEDLRVAEELQEIRQSYPQPNVEGYNYAPAAVAYLKLFERIGLGGKVPRETAAALVHDSPIREQLLAGLDNAAFVARVCLGPENVEVARLLQIARLADPDPSWTDRFRDPKAWQSREVLMKLVDDAHNSGRSVPARQVVIIGALLDGGGSTPETIRVLSDASYHDPGDFWLNLELGDAFGRAGRGAQSCQYYRAALAVRPDNYVLWTTFGVALRNAGAPVECISAFRKAVDLNPRYVTAWCALTDELAGLGRWDEAEAARREASAINPDDADRFLVSFTPKIFAGARALAAKGEWHAAAEEYALAMNHKLTLDSEVCFEYAAVQLLAANRDEYRKTCKHMLAPRTGQAMRRYLVARTCTLGPCMPDDLSRAASLSSEELRQNGSAFWSLTEQGALCYRSGQFTNAVPLFERSIAADDRPGAAVLNWLWLAMAHDKLGHTEESKRWLKKATSWLDSVGPGTRANSPTVSLHLHNFLEAYVLRNEAVGSIDRQTSAD
jgi:serine/threonine-protein kinase